MKEMGAHGGERHDLTSFVKGSLQLLCGGQEQRQGGPLQLVVTTQVSDEGGSARGAAWRRTRPDRSVLHLYQSLH